MEFSEWLEQKCGSKLYFIFLIHFTNFRAPNFETSSWLCWWNNLINPVDFTVVPRLFTACCSVDHIQPNTYTCERSLKIEAACEVATDYTVLHPRKQQTFVTEVSGPSFTAGSPVSLAIKRNFVECRVNCARYSRRLRYNPVVRFWKCQRLTDGAITDGSM